MTPARVAVGAALAGSLLYACAANPVDRAQRAATSATHAVYADDPAALRATLESRLAHAVTREQVGALSDRMHALGSYQGLTYVIADPTTREYTFRANFAHGSMNVVVKLGRSGKLGAYRIFAGS